MKISLICGGPSLERGISLNSARSVLDHLSSERIEIVPFYLDARKNAYRISARELYSNTPSDFDFKLKRAGKPLNDRQFTRALKETDIVFPAMHGPYGEDGGIQSFLETRGIPFVGSGSRACKAAFDKFDANERIRKEGFFTLPSALLKIYGTDHREIVQTFFDEHEITRAVVKPATGGSSIGVFSVSTPEDALRAARTLFGKRMDTRVVIEPFAEGAEFTCIVLQNRFGIPVALPPTEMEMDYSEHQIFDFRKKYLPTRHVAYHCPPRFDDSAIERIQAQAEQLFSLFDMRDFARFDGWILPNGNIWFCDFNTISGMEQNSFFFQQASRVGMTHHDVLRYIVANACKRHGIDLPATDRKRSGNRKAVSVLFGGPTSERQVSLMSGTNVWLKLRGSDRYEPHPYLLDIDGSVWKLPYHLALNHTVEEIGENCGRYAGAKARLAAYEERARLRLGLSSEKDPEDFFDPERLTMDEFISRSPFVFNALHGGAGEDGTMQALFEKHGALFNGPGEAASRLCIDKWATSERIRDLRLDGIGAVPGIVAETKALMAEDGKRFWSGARKTLSAKTVIVKPRGDGCSTGVVHLLSAADLALYVQALRARVPHIPKGTFKHQTDPIEMPSETPAFLIFERFVETDVLRVKANRLKHAKKSGWLEITVGVVEKRALHALNPSIAIAEGEVLSVEEKFQGGTGVNLTPPPPSVIKPAVVRKIRGRMEELAKRIGITGYARIDAFASIRTGELLIIEINTLPGLTPSTVLYHQALAEEPPLPPRELLELLVKNNGY